MRAAAIVFAFAIGFASAATAREYGGSGVSVTIGSSADFSLSCRIDSMVSGDARDSAATRTAPVENTADNTLNRGAPAFNRTSGAVYGRTGDGMVWSSHRIGNTIYTRDSNGRISACTTINAYTYCN